MQFAVFRESSRSGRASLSTRRLLCVLVAAAVPGLSIPTAALAIVDIGGEVFRIVPGDV